MLGLADRTLTFDLLDAVMKGDIRCALTLMTDQYAAGADPVLVLGDMLELVHWLTRIKVVPGVLDAPGVPEAERVRGRTMAEGLSMAQLARAWQMLLKGLGETQTAPGPEQAAEMILVRLAYTADLPTPAEALESLKGNPGERPASAAPLQAAAPKAAPENALAGAAPREEAAQPGARNAPETRPATFADVVALTAEMKEARLHANLISNLHLVSFEPGRIEFHPGDHAPPDLAGQLTTFLNEATDPALGGHGIERSRPGHHQSAETDRGRPGPGRGRRTPAGQGGVGHLSRGHHRGRPSCGRRLESFWLLLTPFVRGHLDLE